MNSLLDIGLLSGYFIVCLMALCKRDSKTSLFAFILLVALGIQSYFATTSLLFEGLDNMWKFYSVMFLIDGLQLICLSANTSKDSITYITGVLLMCIMSFLVMFEAYFTTKATLLYLSYTIAIPVIHIYMLARLAIGAGGVKGIRDSSSTRSSTHSKTNKDSLGGIP